MILRSAHLQRPWCARAMNYLEVYMIDREELLEIARMFPATYKEIHRCAVRLAMRRQVRRPSPDLPLDLPRPPVYLPRSSGRRSYPLPPLTSAVSSSALPRQFILAAKLLAAGGTDDPPSVSPGGTTRSAAKPSQNKIDHMHSNFM